MYFFPNDSLQEITKHWKHKCLNIRLLNLCHTAFALILAMIKWIMFIFSPSHCLFKISPYFQYTMATFQKWGFFSLFPIIIFLSLAKIWKVKIKGNAYTTVPDDIIPSSFNEGREGKQKLKLKTQSFKKNYVHSIVVSHQKIELKLVFIKRF